MKLVSIQNSKEQKDHKFLEILFDERIAEDSFYIPREFFLDAGGFNTKIRGKQTYELLLRLAELYCIKIEEVLENQDIPDDCVCVEYQRADSDMDGIRTDCYIISRYKDKLLEYSCFNEVAESLLEFAGQCGRYQETVALLEQMLSRGDEYYEIDDAVRPVLIYKGEDVCYNILNIFAEQLRAAFERAGQKVEIFDEQKQPLSLLTRYIGKRCRAVIGMQTYLFSLKIKNEEIYLHDLIQAPIYNFTFDHPIWLKKHLQNSPKRLNILTHDADYVEFVEKYYHKKAYLLPPAGDLQEAEGGTKLYDISFVGTYGSYKSEMVLIHRMERKKRFLANRFLLHMRKEPNISAEEAFNRTLDDYGISCPPEEYMDLFYQMRRVIYCVMAYYRHRVIEMLLRSGIRVDVFGSCWKVSPLKKYPNLICHEDVTMEESVQVWKKSKMSLNIMSWHKRSFTERMANIMLCGATLVTDDTAYLDGRFEDGKDMIIFRLDEMEGLAGRVEEYLQDSKKREKIAQNGYKKARQSHTWDCRVREFLEILEDAT